MDIIIKIIAFLVAVFVLTMIHECGHFIVARWCKVKVLRFSIGFGKALYTWKDRHQTEYLLALFPLGGYIKMLDTRESASDEHKHEYKHKSHRRVLADKTDKHATTTSKTIKTAKTLSAAEKRQAFDLKPIWQKMLIIIAGPIANIIFAIIAMWFLLVLGIKTPKLVIGEVVPQSIASKAGLVAGDEIIALNNRPMTDWQKVLMELFSHIGESITLPVTVKHQSQPFHQNPQKHNHRVQVSTVTYHIDLGNWRINEWRLDPLLDLGIDPYQPPVPLVIGEIAKNTPAAKSELRAADKVISINGKEFADWSKMIEFIQQYPSKPLTFLVERHAKKLKIIVTTDWKFGPRWQKIGFLGVKSVPVKWPENMVVERKYSLFTSLQEAPKQIFQQLAFNFIVLEKMISGKISLHFLSGPIGIFQAAATALQHGVIVYIGFLAILSLMLAFVNLLPIPALDGGYLLLLLCEGVLRRPLSLRVQELIIRLGFSLLLVLMIKGVANDIARMF